MLCKKIKKSLLTNGYVGLTEFTNILKLVTKQCGFTDRKTILTVEKLEESA